MTRDKKRKAYRLGHYAEFLAMILLLIKGYTIKERRYRSPLGEIDIIAKKGNTTIFCEVKARKDYDTAAHSITEKQRLRISRSAEYYMSHLKLNNRNNKIENEIYRCDMIMIMPWQWPVHIKNAW